jgi:hypothetical protein
MMIRAARDADRSPRSAPQRRVGFRCSRQIYGVDVILERDAAVSGSASVARVPEKFLTVQWLSSAKITPEKVEKLKIWTEANWSVINRL